MTVEVVVKTVEPIPTAVVVASTTWAEFPKAWGPMLDEVWSFLRTTAPQGLYKRGHNIMLYKDDVPNVEVGVQVSGLFDPVGRVVASTLPGGLVATATHAGQITDIGQTHNAVCTWSKANGYRLAGPRWEIYGDPDPATDDFEVDVVWRLAATSHGSAAGFPTSWSAGTTSRSAWLDRSQDQPRTSSPVAQALTSLPRALTTPARSLPSPQGNTVGNRAPAPRYEYWSDRG